MRGDYNKRTTGDVNLFLLKFGSKIGQNKHTKISMSQYFLAFFVFDANSSEGMSLHLTAVELQE